MSLAPGLLNLLVDYLEATLSEANQGHCARIDHLSREDGLAICSTLQSDGVEAFVLSDDPSSGVEIDHERAIELRNRKAYKLCLFVPPDVGDAVASSLANSFAQFNLEGFFDSAATDLLDSLP